MSDKISEDDFGPSPGASAIHSLASLVAAGLREVGVPNVPEPEPPSSRQRLRITVPHIRTTMSMGSRAPGGGVRQLDTGAPNYDGFGVHSDGHLFVDIEETIGIQSEKSAFIQSQMNMAIGGKSSLIAGSRGGVIMAGGGGVTILGGAPNNWPANVDSDGTDPQEPKWVAPINEASAWVTATASTIDAGVGLLNASKNFKESVLGVEPTALGMMNLASWAGGLLGVAASATGTVAAADSLAGWNLPVGDLADLAAGTLIYGQAGWIGATPMTMGLYSLAGTTIGSVAGVAVNAIGGIDISSVADARLSSVKGSVAVLGDKDVTIKSESQGVTIVSKSGSAGMLGGTISIGSIRGSGGQKATETLNLNAQRVRIDGKFGTSVTGGGLYADTGSIHLAANTAATISAQTHLTISSETTHVGITGKKHVELMCGQTRLLLDGKKVMLGHGPGEPPARPEPPELEASPPAPNAIRAFYDWLRGAKVREKKNAAKVEAYQNALKEYAEKCKNLAETKAGITINDSSVELSVGGHKLTLDSGKVKHAALVLSK